MSFDVAQIDEVLATTRAVRRRLDLERPVDNQMLLDCIDLAEQAPTGGNLGSRRWIIVRDQRVKDQLGELYREGAGSFITSAAERLAGSGHPSEKVACDLQTFTDLALRRLTPSQALKDGRATIVAGTRAALSEVFRVLVYTPHAPLPAHA